LAHSAIIVGDDKQTSPENVGADQSRFFDLLDQYLQRIPRYRTLFNLDNSLYDIANQKFPAQTMLTEHFRSLPEIIEFSNTHIYDGKIVPLRDQPPTPGWRPLGAVKVKDGYRSGDINEPEAAAVVDLIENLCADPKYEDMTFGVVSLLGSSQSKLIWDRLYDRLGPDVLTARRLRCGEPANFQGDERDVMVLSLVAETPSNPTGRLRGAMTKLSDERRINVAASRARDQMWVVHSIDAGRFPPGDLRGALIRHCQAPGELREHLDVLLGRCESPFEKDVVTKILARGYRRVRVQHTVNQYRIDIVVEGPDGRLAVECDGDRWHGPERWEQDRARQEVLERAGWTFERIRGSAFYRTPDAALEPLWRRLEELNIPTGDVPPQPAARSTVIEVAGAGLAKPSAVEPVE
jgi:very-short-patch-repair endonuclease